MTKLRLSGLSLGLVMLSACGGGGDTPPPTTPPPESPQPLPKPTKPIAAKTNYSIFIQQGVVSISNSPDTNFGATALDVWGFTESETNPAGTRLVPGTAIDAEVNKLVTVQVKNNLAATHNFAFVNLPMSEVTASSNNPMAMGETVTYSITPKKSGIYIYADSMNNGVNRSLGLYGVMVVRPATTIGKVVWEGGPGFDKELTWVISDLDYPDWNQVAINTGADKVDTTKYKANYFLMNGMNGFQAMEDPDTTIQGTIGETVLVRIANTGQYSQSLHFHGNHFQVISRNGTRLSEFESQDTINVKPNETAMVLYTIDQLGHYPMHVHTAQMETGGGVYLNGTAAMIVGK